MAGANLIDTGDYSARRYAEFIDSLPAALFRTTIEGQIIYCNHAFADLFGFDSALDLIDYPVIEVREQKSDRLIWQFPPESLISLHKGLQDLIGILFDQKS